MEEVKTYVQVNREDGTVSFGISRMEDIYTKHGGRADAPHRHDFYTVLLVIDGEGEHHIDFNTYPLAPAQVYFMAPGQVHQLREARRSIGFSIVFSHQFLTLNHIPIAFIEDLNLFRDFGESPPLGLDAEECRQLARYGERMLEVQAGGMHLKYEALGAWLKLFLIQCNNLCALPPADYGQTGSLIARFKTLVDARYPDWHATGDYAAALHVTPDHLNRTVKMQTGKTAKAYIQSRIIVAAKRLLYFTDQNQKEIGYALGFREPAHFSAFFKKCTGMSPSRFKAMG